MSELERCLAFSQRLPERLAPRVVPTPHGRAFFVDSLPRVWWLNTVVVDPGQRATAHDLVTEAETVQAPAGLEHRKVEVPDALGFEVEEGFRRLGWTVERLLVMVHRRPAPDRDTGHVDETDADTLAPVWADGIRSGPYGTDEETVRQLVAAQRLRQKAVSVRYFATHAGGRIGSYLELRGRGLASAVLTRALAEAHAAGHDLVFLLADDEDWPRGTACGADHQDARFIRASVCAADRADRRQGETAPKELYRKLGFEPIGTTWGFVRECKR